MKNHYKITISDLQGSRHFSVKKTVKRNLIVFSLAVLFTIGTSLIFNLLQGQRVNTLTDEVTRLDQEVIQYDNLTTSLGEEIEGQKNLISDISRELVEIEKSSGVDSGDVLGLDERMRLIKQFYSEREEEYMEIGSRVKQIEGMVGLDSDQEEQSTDDLASRVDLAGLSASQERILHDNIPSGFPTEVRVITSKFGPRIHPVTKIKSFHKGIDLRAKTGHKVFATADGIVSSANYTELSGNRIIVRHNFGFETRYSHLKSMDVKVGDIVQKGDLIGLSGNTGRSIAPHLHYEIRYIGKSIDPNQFLKWEFGSHEIFTQVRGIQWPSLISLINKQITHQTLQLSQLDQVLQEKLK